MTRPVTYAPTLAGPAFAVCQRCGWNQPLTTRRDRWPTDCPCCDRALNVNGILTRLETKP